jgi:2-iminobutanoate/2-iminopropanoate deaminase
MNLIGESRREFLSKAALTAPMAAVTGIAATTASAEETTPERRVIGGSPSPNFSRAVVFGKVVFVAGVMGTKPGTRDLASPDFEGQCRQALDSLKASVEAAGSSMDKVLKCTCFLTEASDFETMNKVYRGYFPADPPARSTVIVKELVAPGAKIEIDCVTCLP